MTVEFVLLLQKQTRESEKTANKKSMLTTDMEQDAESNQEMGSGVLQRRLRQRQS